MRHFACLLLTMTVCLYASTSGAEASSSDERARPDVSEESKRLIPATALGGAGESCRARSDCQAGLKCIGQVCVDEREGQSCGATSECGGGLRCIDKRCVNTSSGAGATSRDSRGSHAGHDAARFSVTDGATHAFLGVTLGGGLMTAGSDRVLGYPHNSFETVDSAYLFALNGGIFRGRNQISLELSPFTYVFMSGASGPAFEAAISYAYFLPLKRSGDVEVDWPLRAGLGVMAGANNTNGLVYSQLRADVVGPAIRVGRILIDLHLPSFRFATTTTTFSSTLQGYSESAQQRLYLLHWLFGGSVSYCF